MNGPLRNINTNESSLKQEIANLNTSLRKLNTYNRKRNVMMRGLLNGVFTAIGATLGFALFLIIFSRILHGAENIPVLDELIEKTRLYDIIESNLPSSTKPTSVPTPTVRPSTLPSLRPSATPQPTLDPTPTN